jgi:hypothetical protein
VIRSVSGSFVGYKTKDWYAVDIETARPLFYQGSGGFAAIPGVRDAMKGITALRDGGRAEVVVHRTHLPLLTSPEALAQLTPVRSSDWDARDAWAGERGFKLRVLQQQAIDFIDPRRGTLLSDDMRCGKTLSALMSHDPARGQLVICAPLMTRAVWLGWIKRLWPDTPVGVLTGKKKLSKERLEQPIVFCHYDILRHWQSVRRIGTLVFDEAHLICNRKIDRSKAAVLLAALAEKVICATGTPIWSMPPNLWNILGILQPAAWGSFFDFGMRYGEPHHTGYGVEFKGATNVDELNARLSEIKIRRLWSEVQADLPPISRNIVVSDIDEPTSRRLDILAATLRKERTNTAANLALYRAQLCKIKLPTVLAEVKRTIATGEPVVVWTWHTEFAELIKDKLNEKGVVLATAIHGDITPKQRDVLIEQWKNGYFKVLVANMAVAQVGIDFSHSHLPIFAELDWVPAVIAQTEMRTYDPTRAMNVTFIVANHVVDQRIMRSLVTKLNAQDPLGFGAAIDAIDAL